MDEVENPDLPAAGETSPTIRPITDDQDGVTIDLNDSNVTALPALPTAPVKPARPGLRREGSAPPNNPPPAVPEQVNGSTDYSQEAPDSLTLAELKRLRSSFPTTDAPVERETLRDFTQVYDFQYVDAQSLPVELEEWFSYSEKETSRLRQCRTTFDESWRSSNAQDWLDVTEDARRQYVQQQVQVLTQGKDGSTTIDALLSLTYVTLGVWEETAGRENGIDLEDLLCDGPTIDAEVGRYRRSTLQIQWTIAMVDTLFACGAIPAIYSTLRRTCNEAFDSSVSEVNARNETLPKRADESIEMWCCLTIMYVVLEVARSSSDSRGKALRATLSALEPNLVHTFMKLISQLRWNDTAPLPLTKMLLLAWKSILVLFGGMKDIDAIKKSLSDSKEETDMKGQPLITASPLDYHLFRQEISSKYPAYQPPPPLFPLEPENNSILPPLKHRRQSSVVSDVFATVQPVVGADSLMQKPVHIATPAPSPPPSPAIPGKAGKKQNYQTNQLFPFLYPPLSEDSNNLGGKGATELQDVLVGRKWEGSDIPASILEAAELFSTRMRATRAMKQLWATRVEFMKYERGYKGDDIADADEDFEVLPEPPAQETAEQGKPLPQSPVDAKLAAVDQFYRDSLPYMQSVVIILLKAVLQHVTDVVTRNGGQNGLQAGIQFNDNGTSNNTNKPAELNGDGAEGPHEELDKIRSQEIAAKALSAIFLLLLKWFKLNHILQHEYMTQLLLDSNYVPLVLKLWQTQEIGRACHMDIERDDLRFFHFCQTQSRTPPAAEAHAGDAEESEDDAAPPPIKLKRDEEEKTTAALDATHPPEIDELGYPLTPLPQTPIRKFSYRNVLSYVNYLRVLQKVTRRKTHRALLLVSYKSSNHLKKTLKIPIKELRYYTLKLFKSQVPFCGRKWRQGNIRIITAIWLSIPAEFRDDWLGGDVDGTVDDALPLEQSMRELTHWWNVQHYPQVMGVDKQLLEDEVDFFQRELEKIEFARLLIAGDEGELMEEAQAGSWLTGNAIEGF